jgi:hypothetical protein
MLLWLPDQLIGSTRIEYGCIKGGDVEMDPDTIKEVQKKETVV